MRYIISFTVCFALILICFSGCTTDPLGGDTPAPAVPVETPEPTPDATPEPTPEPPSGGVEGALADIMQRIYDALDPPLEVMCMNTELSEDMGASEDDMRPPVTYYIGANGIPFAEGLASEAAIGAIPHSVVLLRIQAGADIEAAKTAIKENADPCKWICVGVDPSDVIVDNIGDLLILIISKRSSELHESFKALAG